MYHDLKLYLHELQSRFPELAKRDLAVSWFSPADLPSHERLDCWGWHEAPSAECSYHQIYLLNALQRAPKYVVRYLLLHEVLHVLIPSRGKCDHPRLFQLAERVHPDFVRANAWLENHAADLVWCWH